MTSLSEITSVTLVPKNIQLLHKNVDIYTVLIC